jgi:signal transduction histidine kinase
MKELVSNIIRHAHASEVEVRITFELPQLMLIVRDNGCGMHDDTWAHDGNGLNNIRSRAAEISASVSISSTLSEGTQTQLNIPLPA